MVLKERIPLNTLAIPFGLAGLAEGWGAATPALSLSPVVSHVLWGVTGLALAWLLVAHVSRGVHSGKPLGGQLRHPAQGPIAALVPITAMLIASDLATVSLVAGRVLLLLSVTAAAVFAGWLIGSWLEGRLALESVHGGYLLPTVAAGLVGADAAAKMGYVALGWALFGVGASFSVVMITILIVRLAFRPPLPDPLLPTMAILVAPPAVAGLAWFSLVGDEGDPVSLALAGLCVLMVLVQFAFIPRYRRLGFSPGFWSFTFPAAAVATDAIVWLGITRPLGWVFLTGVVVAALTVLIATVAAFSRGSAVRRFSSPAAEPEPLAAPGVDARI